MEDYTKEMLADLIKRKVISPDVAYSRDFHNEYLPGIKEYSVQTMGGAGVTPNTYPPQDIMFLLRDYDRKIKGSQTPRDLKYWHTRKKDTQYHELDHILANRSGTKYVHPIVDILGPNIATVLENRLNETIKKNKNDIFKEFPEIASTAYFHRSAPIDELMASLNSLEDTYKIDVTKHPLFKDAFYSKNAVDAYRASSGYRRTRMDAKDPSPYTMDKGFWMRLLDSLR